MSPSSPSPPTEVRSRRLRTRLPRFVESLEDFYSLISRSQITVGILLNFGIRSTHVFELVDGKVLDYSEVDDSYTEYTKGEFRKTIYVKAAAHRAMVLEEVRG